MNDTARKRWTVWWVLTVLSLWAAVAPARAEKDASFPLSGGVDLRLRWRQSVRETDADVYGNASLALGDPLASGLSGALLASGRADLDGDRDAYGYNALDEPHNVFSSAAGGRLLHAYLDLNEILVFRRVRVGRQVGTGRPGIRFDGIRIDTTDLLGGGIEGGRLTLSLFGGVPVHFWEFSRAGDRCVGGAVRFAPHRSLRFALEMAGLRDRSEVRGLETVTRNTTANLSAFWRGHPSLSLSGCLLFVNRGTSDLKLRPSDVFLHAVWHHDAWGLTVRGRFEARFYEREDPVAELNGYGPVMGEQGRYQHGALTMAKALGRQGEVEAGVSGRNLEGDDAVYDRDAAAVHLAVRTRDALLEGLALSLRGEAWEPSGEASRWGLWAEARHKVRSGDVRRILLDLWAAGGVRPWTYVRNGEEEADRVLAFEVGGRWRPIGNVYFKLALGFENDGFDVYSRVDVAAGYRF